jgi:hypothetical protein
MATRSVTIAGTAKVVRFNWPKYAAVLGIVATASVATMFGLPLLFRTALWLVGGVGSIWTVTSLLATWWIYDRRRVYDRVGVGLGPVGDWASVHAGFDDATPHVAAAVGTSPRRVVELSTHASPSLRRARSEGTATSAAVDAVPLASSSLDSVFVTFAAHEIRDPKDQRALFGELHRSLRIDGRLVLTEHLRDPANLAVFGPGAFHFQPAATWVDRAREAGFDLESDGSITPFVRRMVWRR